MKRIVPWIVVAALSACASTSVKNEWKAQEDNGPVLKKVMVIGLTTREDVRRVFEDEFAAALRGRGTEGIASYGTIGAAELEFLDKVTQSAQTSGADGVLVTRLIKVDRETYVSSTAPPVVPYPNVYDYYPEMRSSAYTPLMSATYDVVVLETRLYRVSSGKLVWAGGTETFAPSADTRKEVREFSKIIVQALAKANLI